MDIPNRVFDFIQQNPVYLSINKEIPQCELNIVALFTLTDFLSGFGNMEVEASYTDEEFARERGAVHATCDTHASNTVVVVQQGEETSIKKSNNERYKKDNNGLHFANVAGSTQLANIRSISSNINSRDVTPVTPVTPAIPSNNSANSNAFGATLGVSIASPSQNELLAENVDENENENENENEHDGGLVQDGDGQETITGGPITGTDDIDNAINDDLVNDSNEDSGIDDMYAAEGNDDKNETGRKTSKGTRGDSNARNVTAGGTASGGSIDGFKE